MGSFFKKIKKWFSDEDVLIIKAPVIAPTPLHNQPYDAVFKKRYFSELVEKSDLFKLFVADPIPYGSLPSYDLDGGEKEIITIQDGKPKYIKADWSRINLQLQEYLTEDDILACLLLACKYAQTLDNIYVDDYKNTGGWAAVTGNKIETRLHKNVYVKDFPRTLLLPEQHHLGVVCQGTSQDAVDGMGFFMLLEKVRVV